MIVSQKSTNFPLHRDDVWSDTGEHMIPLGYMMKRVMKRPDWLKQPKVEDIFSVSRCMSKDFCDWIGEWKHNVYYNGYWFFNSPRIIRDIASRRGIVLDDMTLFYYEGQENQYNADTRQWEPFAPVPDFPLCVEPPSHKILHGYDVATYYVNSSAECSPLSCNGLAEDIPTNAHCLLDDFQTAKTLLETGAFENSEPGPYRIIAVYTLT